MGNTAAAGQSAEKRLPGGGNLKQLEIIRVKKGGKQILINNATKFENEELFGFVKGGNKKNTLSQ